MASGSLNVNTISAYRILPLQTDVIPYTEKTIFSVGPSSFLEGYSFYSTFIINNYMDPSTMSTFFISTLNMALESTLRATQINIVSTLQFEDYTSTFINTEELSFNDIIIKTPEISLDSLSSILNTHTYDVIVQGGYSLLLSNLPLGEKFAYVRTVGVFNELDLFGTENTGQTTTTRVGDSVYSQVNTSLYFSLLSQDTTPFSIPQNAQSFHYEIFLQSQNDNTQIAPDFDLYITGANNYMFTFIPNYSFSS